MKTVDVAVNERGTREIGAPASTALAVQPPQPVVGLTAEQFQELLKALKGRSSLFANLHELNDKQEALLNAFASIASAMGIRGFEVLPEPVTRRGRVVELRTPRDAVSARVFLQSGVLELRVAGEAESLCLPEGTRDDDRIARIELRDERGRLLRVTGGEISSRTN